MKPHDTEQVDDGQRDHDQRHGQPEPPVVSRQQSRLKTSFRIISESEQVIMSDLELLSGFCGLV